MRIILTFITAALCGTTVFGYDVHMMQSQVVGYYTSSISQGVSRLSIKADSFDVFPTLGDVVKFDPPHAIVGDVISFDLDGMRQHYRIESYDGTNAVLTTNKDPLPKRISFYGIPLLDSYEIQHNNVTVVKATSSGEVSPDYARETGLKKPARSYGIKVEYISPNDNKQRPLVP